jgi:hypothetical protein
VPQTTIVGLHLPLSVRAATANASIHVPQALTTAEVVVPEILPLWWLTSDGCRYHVVLCCSRFSNTATPRHQNTTNTHQRQRHILCHGEEHRLRRYWCQCHGNNCRLWYARHDFCGDAGIRECGSAFEVKTLTVHTAHHRRLHRSGQETCMGILRVADKEQAGQAAVALSSSQQSSRVHDAAQLCGDNSDTISTAETTTMNSRRLFTRSRSTYSWQKRYLEQRAWTLGKLDGSHLHRPKSSSGVTPNTATAGILHRELDTEDLQITGEPEQSHRPRSPNTSTG